MHKVVVGVCENNEEFQARMHSSRMRTDCCSGHHWMSVLELGWTGQTLLLEADLPGGRPPSWKQTPLWEAEGRPPLREADPPVNRQTLLKI